MCVFMGGRMDEKQAPRLVVCNGVDVEVPRHQPRNARVPGHVGYVPGGGREGQRYLWSAEGGRGLWWGAGKAESGKGKPAPAQLCELRVAYSRERGSPVARVSGLQVGVEDVQLAGANLGRAGQGGTVRRRKGATQAEGRERICRAWAGENAGYGWGAGRGAGNRVSVSGRPAVLSSTSQLLSPPRSRPFVWPAPAASRVRFPSPRLRRCAAPCRSGTRPSPQLEAWRLKQDLTVNRGRGKGGDTVKLWVRLRLVVVCKTEGRAVHRRIASSDDHELPHYNKTRIDALAHPSQSTRAAPAGRA